jgi:hypothetical protein
MGTDITELPETSRHGDKLIRDLIPVSEILELVIQIPALRLPVFADKFEHAAQEYTIRVGINASYSCSSFVSLMDSPRQPCRGGLVRLWKE